MRLKNSVILKQTFTLIIMAIFFASTIMMIWLTFLTSHFRNQRTVETLKQKSLALAASIQQYENSEISAHALELLLQQAPKLLNTGIIIDLNRQTNWGKAYYPEDIYWNEVSSTSFYTYLSKYRPDIYNGNSVVFSVKYTSFDNTSSNLLFVGNPITHIENDTTEYIGSVYLIKNLSEDNLDLKPMLLAFLASLCLTIGMMFFPAIYVINLILHPLFEIRDITKNISEGDFSQSLTEDYRGELKELSQAINTMSISLQKTFRELESESHRLSQILNSLNEGIIAFSSSLKVTHINPVFLNYFPETYIHTGEEVDKLGHAEVIHHIKEVNLYGEYSSFTLPQNNRTLSCFFLPLPSNENKEKFGVVCLFKDITQQERLEQTRKDYVANVSHELKTPITALRCLIEPIMDGMVTNEKDLQKYYQIIYTETLRLSRLIDDILELSRLQSGHLHFNFEVFPLEDLLESVNTKLSPIMKEKKLHFYVDIDKKSSPLIWADLDRIEQILYILADNAMKFTPAGGEIHITGTQKGETYYLSLTDSGAGISSEDIEHIFDRFYKADKSHSTKGTGLGLSIAKEIMEMMGETITVHSELGKGAQFTISLQVASPSFLESLENEKNRERDD